MTSEAFRTQPLFLRDQFPQVNTLGIPLVKDPHISLENPELIGYDKISGKETQKIVHFFLDDYKFEALWKNPEPRVEKLREFRAVLTPQFSLYTEMPPAMQMYNIFRSRWVGAYLQSKGLKVIPTVYWGEPQSFWFCFEGIEPGSPVAVSTLGVRREKTLFLQGYEELLRRVHPSHILCYGEPFHEMKGSVLTIPYAQTNHLGTAKKAAPAPYYIKWTTGHVIGTEVPFGGFLPTETEPREFPEKGMGRAGRAESGIKDTEAPKTNKELERMAKDLGYEKTRDKSKGQRVYKNKNGKSPKYITRDIDSHNGGVWKGANSAKDLRNRTLRKGTYDKNLNRLGD